MNKVFVSRTRAIIAAVLSAAVAMACSGTVNGPLGSSKKALSVVGLTIEGPGTLRVGDVQQYTVLASYDDDTTFDVTPSVTWSSSDPTIASAATEPAGQVTALAAGQFVITVSNDGGTSASLTIVVNDPAAQPAAPQLVQVIVSGPGTLNVGDTWPYTAMAIYDDGSTADLTLSASWSSSDPTIASLDADVVGQVNAVSPGSVVVTATDSSGISGSLAINVQNLVQPDPPPADILLLDTP
jgi:uncharacterized protein YjdB